LQVKINAPLFTEGASVHQTLISWFHAHPGRLNHVGAFNDATISDVVPFHEFTKVVLGLRHDAIDGAQEFVELAFTRHTPTTVLRGLQFVVVNQLRALALQRGVKGGYQERLRQHTAIKRGNIQSRMQRNTHSGAPLSNINYSRNITHIAAHCRRARKRTLHV